MSEYNKDKLITAISQKLNSHDYHTHDLVNFMDDEVDWDEVAKVVVTFLSHLKVLELEDE
jgi:hypothetical protein